MATLTPTLTLTRPDLLSDSLRISVTEEYTLTQAAELKRRINSTTTR